MQKIIFCLIYALSIYKCSYDICMIPSPKNHFLVTMMNFPFHLKILNALMYAFTGECIYGYTWFLEENCLPMDNFNGFYTTRCDKRCGGVLLCFKKCFKSYEMSNLSGAYDCFELSTIVYKFMQGITYLFLYYRFIRPDQLIFLSIRFYLIYLIYK